MFKYFWLVEKHGPFISLLLKKISCQKRFGRYDQPRLIFLKKIQLPVVSKHVKSRWRFAGGPIVALDWMLAGISKTTGLIWKRIFGWLLMGQESNQTKIAPIKQTHQVHLCVHKNACQKLDCVGHWSDSRWPLIRTSPGTYTSTL